MKHYFRNARLIHSRTRFIVEMSKRKRTLHVGACDAPFTKRKFLENNLLHQHLSRTTSTLLGIDIDNDSINYLKDNGISNIQYFNIEEYGKLDFNAEIVIFGETIEHLMNVNNSLLSIAELMQKGSKIIITTPNVFYVKNVINCMRGFEICHPDHKVGFTPYTLTAMLEHSGFKCQEVNFSFIDRPERPFSSYMFKAISTAFPLLAENLIVIAEKR